MIRIRLMLYGFFFACLCTQAIQAQHKQDATIYLADPTVFYHKHTYYLYGTDGFSPDSGFHVAVSNNLVKWKKNSVNARALTRGETFGSKGFWAPQVFVHHNKIYMAYTANEQIAIAVSEHPVGPFKQKQLQPLAATVKQIDPFVFKDDDGKLYLYHVRLKDGNRIFGAVLNDDLSAIDTSTLRECISATVNPQPWENTATVTWTVTEGPTVIKRAGKYYMFYSANDFRNPDYAVGFAIASHPLGPWTKSSQNPIITRRVTGANGSGHGDLVSDHKGNLYYVFHTHFSNEKVAPRKTAMIKISWAGTPDQEKIHAEAGSLRFLKYVD